ncbi:hypothetical protein [Enterococcus sp. DIV1059_2]|uniref:hypothetical protein n=1 Tax=Enterococcus sp. DIV1059_2 TaxID=2774664 RepID=UPI003F68249E
MEEILNQILEEQRKQTEILQSIDSRLKEKDKLYGEDFFNEINKLSKEFEKVHSINPEKIYLLAVLDSSFGAQSMTLKKLLFSL